MARTTFRTAIVKDGSSCSIPIDFDPKPIFGKLRAPVRVTLNGYTYRSTIFSMDGQTFIPLRKSHREAAGLEGGESLDVTLELDVGERTVEIPADLAEALTSEGRAKWDASSFTRRREWAEAVTTAKKAETRQRRIDQIVQELERPSAP